MIERRVRAIDRHAYAPDASHFLLVPEEVLVPADIDDVASLLTQSSAAGQPITFRSGGTSLSGQSVTEAALVDVRKGFRRVAVLDGGERVRSGSGSTVRQVNSALLRHGRKIGPDPASEVACTIGGVIANNSSGMSCGTVANSYATIESMLFVLPSGTVVDSGAPGAGAELARREPAIVEGLITLRDRVRSDPASVATIRRLFAMKNTMGYGLNALLDFEEPLEILTHLIVGSEGTLAFVAESTLHTVPLRSHIATALTVFPDLASAAGMLPQLLSTGASALELMDASSLRVGASDPDAPNAIRRLDVVDHAALLVEYEAGTADELAALVAAGESVLREVGIGERLFTSDPHERADLWHMRKGLYAAVAGARAPGTTALLEDIVVPVARLRDTCERVRELLAEHGYPEGVIFGHAKDGNVHFMITDDFAAIGALERFAAFTDGLVDLVLDAEGSLKAEHGTGRMMAPFVRRQYGDELYDVMRELKHLIDPANVLNPGVIITDDERLHLRNITWSPTIESEADRCVECGYCEPMCPSRDLTLTPRQRIVVRRAAERARLAGDAELVAEIDQEFEYDGVQTCAVDGMCQTSCPVQINTGDLVKRLRRADHSPVESAAWSTAAGAWSTATAAGSAVMTVTSRLPASVVRGPNKIARAVLGDDRVPLWSPELPAGGRRRARPTPGPGDAVAAYLPACVNAMFGPESGPGVQVSFEELCAKAGVRVDVVDSVDDLCCGTPWSSKGLPIGHDRMRERVVVAVSRATRAGRIPLICDASSCTEGLRAMLAHDLPNVRVIDAVTFTAQELLPRLPETRRMGELALHPTCSSTRMRIDADLVAVARSVADDVVVALDWGCCAFAGDRGMLHPELTASATARQAAEILNSAADAHASCNRTCELGMTRATGHPYRHVLELLADAHRDRSNRG